MSMIKSTFHFEIKRLLRTYFLHICKRIYLFRRVFLHRIEKYVYYLLDDNSSAHKRHLGNSITAQQLHKITLNILSFPATRILIPKVKTFFTYLFVTSKARKPKSSQKVHSFVHSFSSFVLSSFKESTPL